MLGEVNIDRFSCEGTSKGRLSLTGDTSWKKEICHSGGYYKHKAKTHVTSHLVSKNDSEGRYYDGRWFGFKVIMFNMKNDKSVKMESYLDNNGNNNWTKITNLIDKGDWYVSNSDFYDMDCNKPKKLHCYQFRTKSRL
jgi:hypothetical protein